MFNRLSYAMNSEFYTLDTLHMGHEASKKHCVYPWYSMMLLDDDNMQMR